MGNLSSKILTAWSGYLPLASESSAAGTGIDLLCCLEQKCTDAT
jgi:hypothetical protein